MEKKRSASYFGIFSLLSFCSVYSMMMYTGKSLAALAIVQAGAAAASVIAAFLLHRIGSKNGFGRIFAVLYAAVFIAEAVVTLLRSAMFLLSFTQPSARFFAYIAALILLCVFAARKGLRTVARCSVIFLAGSALLDILAAVMLSFRFSPDSLPDVRTSVEQLPETLGAASFELAALPVLTFLSDELPKGSSKPLLVWSVGLPVFCSIISLLAAGALGDYSRFVGYPFYTAVQTIGFGAFQRLDVIFLCARAIGVFIVTSLIFCGIDRAGRTFLDEKRAGAFTYIIGVMIGAVIFISSKYRGLCDLILNNGVMTIIMLIGVFILPSAALVLGAKLIIRKRVVKTAAVMLAVAVMTTALTGCDKVQLQDRMMIKGVGIDEKNGEYLLSVQYVDNFSDGDKQENKLLCTSGSSIAQALGALKESSGSEPFLGQTSALIFGREAAKKDIGAMLDYFVSYSEVRPTVRLYLSETTAYDILSFEDSGSLVPIDHITSISPSASKNDNRFTMMSMMNERESKTSAPTAAVLGINAGAIRLSSVAYFSQRGVYTLNENEYTAYCLLNDIKNETVVTADNISCEVTSCKTRVHCDFDGERLSFSAECIPQMCILEDPNGSGKDRAEAAISERLETVFTDSVKAVLNENGCDIFGFGDSLSASEIETIGGKREYEQLLKTSRTDIAVNCRVISAKALR